MSLYCIIAWLSIYLFSRNVIADTLIPISDTDSCTPTDSDRPESNESNQGTFTDPVTNLKNTLLSLELTGADPEWSCLSLGPKIYSQSHFHSLQLLNVPQFLFSRVVGLKTAPRGNFSHA